MAKPRVTKIREILDSQGRSMSWLARKMRINRTVLYQIDWGERPITDEFVERAADCLQVPRDFIFFLPSDVRISTKSVSEGTTSYSCNTDKQLHQKEEPADAAT